MTCTHLHICLPPPLPLTSLPPSPPLPHTTSEEWEQQQLADELANNPNPADGLDATADSKTDGAAADTATTPAKGGGVGSPAKGDTRGEPGWLTKAAMKTAAALRGGADTGKSLFVALATGNLTVDGGGVKVVDDRLQTRVSRQVSGDG